MVAPFDLTRYRPPLARLEAEAQALIALLDGGVDPEFVRSEMAALLHELAEFSKARFSFGRLESKIRGATTVDAESLTAAFDVVNAAPKDDEPVFGDVPDRLSSLQKAISAIRDNQHRWPQLETLLRVQLALEGWFSDAVMSIADDWNPEPLLVLVRPKLAALSEQQRSDLWSQVLAEHRPDEDAGVRDRRLEDHGVLPPNFLQSAPSDSIERLARYHAWLRPQVLKKMISRGRDSYPIPDVGLARLLSVRIIDAAPTATELAIARAIGNLAGWLALKGQPISVEDFARLIALAPDSLLVQGDERRSFQTRRWTGNAAERAALHSILTIASGVEAIHGHEGPLDVALFQYRAGIELVSGSPDSLKPWKEVRLQKHLCRFLLERGILSVGTKFGQHETDLVANVGPEYIVLECKVLKKVPAITSLERNLAQLLRYDALNPAFRGRRAVLVLYNFSSVPIIVPREPIAGTTWLLALNVNAGPPSSTRRCVKIVADSAHVLRCTNIGERRSARKSKGRSQRRPR